MTVTDDPYSSSMRAEISAPIPPVTGWRRYCYTGGALRLWVAKQRNGQVLGYGVTAALASLRSPGEITSIDLLGGAPLGHEMRDTGEPRCYGGYGCHNDALLSYQIPDALVEKIAAGEDLPVRISSSSGDECAVQGAIHSEDIRRLRAWANGG